MDQQPNDRSSSYWIIHAMRIACVLRPTAAGNCVVALHVGRVAVSLNVFAVTRCIVVSLECT